MCEECGECLTGVRLRFSDCPPNAGTSTLLNLVFPSTCVLTSVRRMCGRGARGASQWVSGGGQVQSHSPRRRDRRQRRWPLTSHCWQSGGSGERRQTATNKALPDRSATSDSPGAPVLAWDSRQGARKPHLGR